MTPANAQPLVLIIGAGISGLLLAQQLKREGISYRIFERDADLQTRGAGWGLTLHWSLPALQSLLPSELAQRICDESSVDRWADRRGEASRFPFFDLDSGELKAQTPGAVKSARIRVTRQRLRRLLAEGIDIEVREAAVAVLSMAAVDEDGESDVMDDVSCTFQVLLLSVPTLPLEVLADSCSTSIHDMVFLLQFSFRSHYYDIFVFHLCSPPMIVAASLNNRTLFSYRT
jgi:hypothetical protein